MFCLEPGGGGATWVASSLRHASTRVTHLEDATLWALVARAGRRADVAAFGRSPGGGGAPTYDTPQSTSSDGLQSRAAPSRSVCSRDESSPV